MPSQLWQRVKPIFYRASELASSGRSAYLNEACHGDTELRSEVERLLELHDASAVFLDNPAPEATINEIANDPQRTFRADETLSDRFRIVRFVGSGGMGEVYEANDLELKERVALKTLRPELVFDESSQARFKREIQLARRVSHKNVCRIFDGGRHRANDREIAFLTMEYLEGETLSAYLKREGKLSSEKALPLLRQMAEGLVALHEANIIHRDFKSANVILTHAADGSERAVVTDFGLARPAVFGSRTESVETHPGQMLGTLDYVAPEQLAGELVGPYSDVYSFGVVAYEMFCGRRPFPSDAMAKVIVQKLTQLPKPPSEVIPGFDPRWEELILGCLKRGPEERIVSPQEILRLLDELAPPSDKSKPIGSVLHENAAARSLPQDFATANKTGTATPRLRLRSRWVGSTAAVAATAGLAALAYGAPSVREPALRELCSWFPGSAWACELPADKDVAILPFTVSATLPRDEPLAAGLVSFTHDSFYQLYPGKRDMCVHVRSRSQGATSYGVRLAIAGNLVVDGESIRFTSRVEELADPKAAQPTPTRLVRTIELSDSKDDPRGFVEQSLLDMAQALELDFPSDQWTAWREQIPQDPDAFAAYLRGLGLLQAGQAKVDLEATPELIAAAEQFSLAIDRTYTFARAHAALGDAYGALFRKTLDTSWATKARNAYQQALGLDPDSAPVRKGLAELALARGDDLAAIEEYAEANRLNPFDYRIQAGYASALETAGESDKTETLWKQSLEIRPQCWYGYNQIARYYLNHGRHEEAARALQTIVRLAPDHAAAHHNLAFVYIKLGRYDDAIERAADSVRFNIGPAGYSTLGRAYLSRGCQADALLNLRHALDEADRIDRESGQAYARRYTLWKNLGDALTISGNESEAREAFQQTVRFSREFLADQPRYRVALGYLALSLARLGQTASALQVIETAIDVAPDNEETLFQAATVYEFAGLRDRALTLLKSAFENGLYVHEVQQTSGLEELQADPIYLNLLSSFDLDPRADPGSTTLFADVTGCPEWLQAGKGLRDRAPNP